jgi:hypothetical protein
MGTYMTKELEEWLRYHWRRDNHPKYQRYFDEWMANLLPTQIEYFKKQMYNEKNGVLGKTLENKK